jgi:hypothetical protein
MDHRDFIAKGGPGSGPHPGDGLQHVVTPENLRAKVVDKLHRAAEHLRNQSARMARLSPHGDNFHGSIRRDAMADMMDHIVRNVAERSAPHSDDFKSLRDHVNELSNHPAMQGPKSSDSTYAKQEISGTRDGIKAALAILGPASDAEDALLVSKSQRGKIEQGLGATHTPDATTRKSGFSTNELLGYTMLPFPKESY